MTKLPLLLVAAVVFAGNAIVQEDEVRQLESAESGVVCSICKAEGKESYAYNSWDKVPGPPTSGFCTKGYSCSRNHGWQITGPCNLLYGEWEIVRVTR